jgi:hypothetical protein
VSEFPKKQANPIELEIEKIRDPARYSTALHRTVTRLLPPVVHVYSDKSNPLVIISSVALPGSVSKRTTS